MMERPKKTPGRPVKMVEDPEANPVIAMRTLRGMSQEDLAKKVGLHRNTIGRIERGERTRVKVEVFEKIAQALDCELWQVVPGIFTQEQRQLLEAYDRASPELRVVMKNIVEAIKKGA